MLKRLRRRYLSAVSAIDTGVRPASALRAAFQAGYVWADFRADVTAGITVGAVALPLSMALAIASGMPPQNGLYTAIVAGVLSALLGGSRTQVSGPSASAVVLAPIAARYGPAGLLTATMMAGAILMLLGTLRLGRFIQWIPHPVSSGFTAGIAVVIATLQVRDLLGLQVAGDPAGWLEKVGSLAEALPTVSAGDAAIGALTLALLLLWPRVTTRIPAPFAALVLASFAAAAVPGGVATVGSRFGTETRPGIPSSLPAFAPPWSLGGGSAGEFHLDLPTVEALFLAAFAIAMLSAIESLLSAVVADGMTGDHHDPDAELLAQGTSNLVAPFFGGFASTGALARTATNTRAGARSPLAAVAHSVFILAAMLAFEPLLEQLPMAALAAMLIVVAWNIADLPHLRHVLQVAPRSDVAVLLVCLALTVLFNMVVAVTIGIMLAALLFMGRMAELTGVRVHEAGAVVGTRQRLPEGVVLYQIAGPLFFGAAQKAVGALDTVASNVAVVVLDLSAVPAMDATGLVALESALERLERTATQVILTGVQAQPSELIQRAGLLDGDGVRSAATLDEALSLAAAAALDRSANGHRA